MGDLQRCWKYSLFELHIFVDSSVTGLHTGPMKTSGSIDPGIILPCSSFFLIRAVTRVYGETCDGYFDRISLSIDPVFGTEQEYQKMVQAANAKSAIILGDLIPGHTGKGADFILATLNYKEYPGMYSMVEVARADWAHLPEVPASLTSVNLSHEEVEWFVVISLNCCVN